MPPFYIFFIAFLTHTIAILFVDMNIDVTVEQEEKEEWAKPLTHLWQCQPYDPQAEREYNRSMGKHAPYCSICLLFHTYHQVRAKRM